jgi:hypothetical protein
LSAQTTCCVQTFYVHTMTCTQTLQCTQSIVQSLKQRVRTLVTLPANLLHTAEELTHDWLIDWLFNLKCENIYLQQTNAKWN